MPIYTRTGDTGSTSLFDEKRVLKRESSPLTSAHPVVREASFLRNPAKSATVGV